MLQRLLAQDHNLDALRDAVRAGAQPKYLFFWGHTAKRAGTIRQECLSQWYPATFIENGRVFATAEHYMMFHKATLFGDTEIAERALDAPSPGAAKSLGRAVRGFDEAEWEAQRSGIVIAANLEKFAQNAALKAFLLATGDQVLVEASPKDTVWGIGLDASDPAARDPWQWRGLNLLGFALMTVRDRLRDSNGEG